ncbi:hypothetical protein, partial [Paraburkholderia sp. SIMBA_053]|uniref:hypothetical protein n=1 Tax=Paraburkholderia sp. SIMBA_053 TaxID=3085794 RepID=UPI00397C5627
GVIFEQRKTKVEGNQVALVVWPVVRPKASDIEGNLILVVGLPSCRWRVARPNCIARRLRVFDRAIGRRVKRFPSPSPELVL